MKLTSKVKPISYIKANAAEILQQLEATREPVVITLNGEAKAVLQDLESYEDTQETLALLKILALGQKEDETGQVRPANEVIQRLRGRLGTGG